MRNIISIVLLTICSQSVQAQSDFDVQIHPKKPDEYLRKNKPVLQNATPLALLQLPGDTARYSHSVIQGNIYAMPQDNMPCLVPDKKSYACNQPNLLLKQVQPFTLKNSTDPANPAPVNTMPNAYQGKPLVWEKKP